VPAEKLDCLHPVCSLQLERRGVASSPLHVSGKLHGNAAPSPAGKPSTAETKRHSLFARLATAETMPQVAFSFDGYPTRLVKSYLKTKAYADIGLRYTTLRGIMSL